MTDQTHPTDGVVVRLFTTADAESWLRCRLLAFLGTQYYDDVRTSAELDGETLRLVAADGDVVVGILDVEIDGEAATIDTVAVLPERAGRGLATRMLEMALAELRERGVRTLDAWTREDVAANAWYVARGFTEEFRYLHVYRGWQDPADGFTTPDGLSAPVIAFCHGRIEHEAAMRERFARVYVCRQYVRGVVG